MGGCGVGGLVGNVLIFAAERIYSVLARIWNCGWTVSLCMSVYLNSGRILRLDGSIIARPECMTGWKRISLDFIGVREVNGGGNRFYS